MSKTIKLFVFIFLIAGAMATGACTTSSNQRADTWPKLAALPDSPPSDLNKNAPGAVLRPGGDGFVYVVGMTDTPAVGTPFVARYSGKWPIRELDRPGLTAGRLVRDYGEGVGLVHLTYQVPNTSIEDLQVNWSEKGSDDHLGKGLATVSSVAKKGTRAVTLSIGKDRGVRDGDFYALLSRPQPSDKKKVDARDLQLSRRLQGVCMVQEAKDDSARCLLWPGSKLHPRVASPQKGQEAVFLEHTFGAAPRDGIIQVAAVKDGDETLQKQLADAMDKYLKSVTEPKAEVATIDTALDATAEDFYRLGEELEHLGSPQLVIGSSVAEVDGEKHLIATYTGVGPASGPGMVAAPPDRGVDLGPIDDIDQTRLKNFMGTVWSGMLVYRGQTSEALIQLHQLLSDPKVTGPIRWHLRDQYAMRWGALDHYREALWLVLQDETIAANRDDREAWLNALGTRVRLYDFLDLPARAVSEAKRYLDARQQDKPGPSWRSAVAMYGEMLMTDGRVDDAMATVDTLEKACPKGCNGDLNSHVAGIYWSVPPDHEEVQQKLLDFLVDHVDDSDPTQLAATRLYQGINSMNEEDFTQALIAFLEADRLYEKVKNINGQARAQYFAFMAELGRGEPQAAFERGRAAQKLEMKLNDYGGVAQLFERMSVLYTNPDFLEKPGPFLGGARQILSGAVESKIAMGDFGGASENLLSLGSFMLKIGQEEQAKEVMTEAVGYAISFKRFDVAAMSHLYLGVIARQQGDMATFRSEIEKAQLMADLSDDPNIKKAVEDVLNPKKEEDVPTQLL